MTRRMSRFLQQSLSLRLGLWIALFLLPSLLLGGWLLSKVYLALTHSLQNTAQMVAQHSLETLDRLVFERYGDTLAFSKLPTVKALDQPQLQSLLDHLVTTYAPYYRLAMVIGRDGQILAVNRVDGTGQPLATAALVGNTVAGEPWFEQALQSRAPVQVEDFHQDGLVNIVYRDQQPVMSLTASIGDAEGNVIGLWSTRLALEPLAQTILHASRAYSATTPLPIVLLNGHGDELVSVNGSAAARFGPQTFQSSRRVPLASALSRGYSTYPGLGWRIAVFQPPSEMDLPVLFLWLAVWLGLVLVVGGAGLWWVIDRRIVIPVQILRRLVERLGRGEPVSAAECPADRSDELGQLARAVVATSSQIAQQLVRLQGFHAVGHALQRAHLLENTPESLTQFLQLVADTAVRLTGARYGAVGMFDEQGERLTQFLTVGIDEATKAAIGGLPTGRGLLGFLPQAEGVLRLKDLTQHPTFTGFPPHHPDMRSFLGALIHAHGRLLGRLYLTEKCGAPEFTETDAEVVDVLATQAGLAIEGGQYVARIRAAQALYQTTTASLPVALVRVDQDGAIRFANPAFYDLVQRTDAETIGQPIEAVLPVEELGGFLRAFRTEGRVVEREVTCPLHPAARRMLRLIVTGMHPAAAAAAAAAAADLILIIEDITEAKRAEAALWSKTEQLQAITDAMTAFVSTGNWREASARLLRAALSQTGSEYGFVGVVVDGRVLRILAHEGVVWDDKTNREFYEQAQRVYQEVGYLEFTNFENLFGKVITTGQPVLSNDPGADPCAGGIPPGHPRLRCFLGVPILTGARVVGMIGIANRPSGYTGEEQQQLEILTRAASVIYDSYDRQEREVALEQQLRQTEKLAALGTLLGGVAHELNNPLFAISGRTELARERVAAGDYETLGDDLAAIGEATDRATAVIQRFLGVTRSTPERRAPCAVNAVIDRALELVANDCAIHQIAVQRDLHRALPAVLADPEEFNQVLLNLLTNARQAMAQAHGQGTLTVTSTLVGNQTGPWVEIRVADDGPGIAPEHLPRIFEPFFSTKPVGEGTGLGLWVSHQIVAEMGGTLTCQSIPGQGATFLIRLPAAN